MRLSEPTWPLTALSKAPASAGHGAWVHLVPACPPAQLLSWESEALRLAGGADGDLPQNGRVMESRECQGQSRDTVGCVDV